MNQKSASDENGTIAVHRATSADSKDIWLWRNDLQTRAMSITADEVNWQSHRIWYENSLKSKNRYLYVGYLNNAEDKVGMSRFDVDNKRSLAEVSININPAKRGLNLSHHLLSAAISEFKAERKTDFTATIKKQNTASIKCFKKCGFVLHSEDGEYNYYKLIG